MFKNTKDSLSQVAFLKNLYLLTKADLKMIYNPDDLTNDYYDKIKNLGDEELEHQIGRLTNFKKIILEIKSQEISGDVLEFGTYQGFSLLWTAYLMERAGIFRKIVGIDGFTGLLNSEGNFIKGTFNGVSLKKCFNNLKYSQLYQLTKNNIKIEKYLYSQKDEIIKMLKRATDKQFCFIHIDCDISSSVIEIFKILRAGNFISDTCYLLFDDYGCMESYQKTVDRLLSDLEEGWQISEHSKTKLTRNFLLKRK
jgi:hypothetical protein